MKIDALGKELSELMEEETEFLNKISCEEENLQSALRGCTWEELEKTINILTPLSTKIEELEDRRSVVFEQLKQLLGKTEEDGFYAVAMHLSGEIRETCLSGYRKMKVALIRMQGITVSIDQYVKSVGETSRSVLDEVFPHRKGNIYSRCGNAKPVQSDPMVLNRQL